MKLQRTLIFLTGCFNIGFASFSIPAMAQTQPDCRSPQTQAELNRCAAQEERAADRQLNQTYQEVRAKLKGSPSEIQLIDAQSAWIKFRDMACLYERDRYKGGSMAPMVGAHCIARITKQRTQDLQNSLQEGN